MKKVLVFFFIIFHLFGFSQKSTTITIKGIVTGVNEHPISNVNISVIGSSKGTKTNKKGLFLLSINKTERTIEDVILKFSHINYYTKNKILVGDVLNDTLKISIHLTEKINFLSTFEISTEKIELLYNKPFVTILDYQFYEDKLLLLSKENKNIKLKLLNLNQEEEFVMKMTKNATTLHKDCFGNIHVLSSDSSYQLLVDNAYLSIAYTVGLSTFNAYLKPCIANVKNRLLFKQEDRNINSVVYYTIDENKSINVLKKITDQLGQLYAAVTTREKKMMENPENSKMLESKAAVYAARDVSNDIAFINLLKKGLAENPLFVIKDAVYIFDHPKNTCWVFDDNLLHNRTFSLAYKEQKKWKGKLIVDKEQGAVYAKFEKNGLCYLKKIDLTTGKIVESYKLEKHTYPTNIKIRNGEAYYLYKDHFNHGQMSLYKQGLY